MIEGESAAHQPWHCERSHMDEPARVSPTNGEPHIRLVPGTLPPTPSVDSYRRLADVFHDLLSEQSLDSLLVRIADTLDEIVPYEALHIYEADEPNRATRAGARAKRVTSQRDPQRGRLPASASASPAGPSSTASPCSRTRLTSTLASRFVPGTPLEPEALIVVPLIARGALKGTSTSTGSARTQRLQRRGVRARRSALGDAAALALDNAAHPLRGSSARRRPTRSRASTTTATSTSAFAARADPARRASTRTSPS